MPITSVARNCGARLVSGQNYEQSELLKILEGIHSGAFSPEKAAEHLKHLPFEDIGFAKVDSSPRVTAGLRRGDFGKGKTPAQVAEIVRAMVS